MYGQEQLNALNQSARCACDGSSIVDVCDLCKNGDQQMSPDSVIYTSESCEGCRTEPDAAGTDVEIVGGDVNVPVDDGNKEGYTPRRKGRRYPSNSERTIRVADDDTIIPTPDQYQFNSVDNEQQSQVARNESYECPCKKRIRTVLEKEGFQRM